LVEILSPDALWWKTFFQFLFAGLSLSIFVGAVFFYFAAKYRAKNPNDFDFENKIPVSKSKIGWTKYSLIITGIIVTILIFSTFPRTDYVEASPPSTDLVIWVTAFQFGWEFQYPNGKKVVNTLVLPVDTTVEFKITSRDVMHSFGIPEIKGAKIDAIPGILNSLWIKTPDKPVEYKIYCYELCGIGHSFMVGTIKVVSWDEYESFVSSQ